MTEDDLRAEFDRFSQATRDKLEHLAALQLDLAAHLQDGDEHMVSGRARMRIYATRALQITSVLFAASFSYAVFDVVTRGASAFVPITSTTTGATSWGPGAVGIAAASFVLLLFTFAWALVAGVRDPLRQSEGEAFRLSKKKRQVERELRASSGGPTRFGLIVHVRRLQRQIQIEPPQVAFDAELTRETRQRLFEEGMRRRSSAQLNLGLGIVLICALGAYIVFLELPNQHKLTTEMILANSLVTGGLSVLIFFFLWTYRLHHSEAKHFSNEMTTVELRLLGWYAFQYLWSENAKQIPETVRSDIWKSYAVVLSEFANAERNSNFKPGEHNQTTRQLTSESKWFRWLTDLLNRRK